MQIEDQKALELLKQIFLNESNQKHEEFEDELNKLKYQLTDKEAKIQAYYPIITDLLERKIIDSQDELAKVLSPLMAKAIKEQVINSKDDIIDALYPIMGDAIKRSVSESIKEIYTSINIKIENALRTGIFSKRIKSKITGISATDLILQESFPFNVSEIFLIHESSGLLITHVSSSESEISSDGDLISGMLTAIKDFVSESFKKNGGSQNLYEIQYGDSKIVLERGLYSYLAVVISGQEPIHFHGDLSDLNTELYSDHHKKLREYNGESSQYPEIDKLTINFIEKYKYVPKVEEEYKPAPVLLYLIIAALGIFLIILGIIKLPQYFEDKSTETLIGNQLSEINNLDMENINWSSSNGNVEISGFIDSYKLKKQIDSTIAAISAVKKLDSQIYVALRNYPQDSVMANIRESLSGYDTTTLTYQLIDNKIIVEGQVETDDHKRRVAHLISNVPGISVVINNLIVAKGTEYFDYIKDEIGKTILGYGFLDSDLTSIHKTKLDKIVGYLTNYKNTLLIITACSVGNNSAANLSKAHERAEDVANYISSKGIASNRYIVKQVVIDDTSSKLNNNERFVQFELQFGTNGK